MASKFTEEYFAPSATFSEQFQDETERSIEQPFEPYPSLNDDQIPIPGSDQADTESDAKSDDSPNHNITQEEIDKYNNTQPVPDTNGLITFITGTYSGIFRSCSGRPAYMIAAGVLFFSITFIVNAFLPISQRYRPKNGLTLAALALVLETALR